MNLPPIQKAGHPRLAIKYDFAFEDHGTAEIELTNEGMGSFVIITADKWRVDADELIALAAWMKAQCDDIDKFNKDEFKV